MRGEMTVETVKTKRLISAVLVALSVLMLFFGWIGVKGEYRSDVKSELKTLVEELDEYIDEYDVYGS